MIIVLNAFITTIYILQQKIVSYNVIMVICIIMFKENVKYVLLVVNHVMDNQIINVYLVSLIIIFIRINVGNHNVQYQLIMNKEFVNNVINIV